MPPLALPSNDGCRCCWHSSGHWDVSVYWSSRAEAHFHPSGCRHVHCITALTLVGAGTKPVPSKLVLLPVYIIQVAFCTFITYRMSLYSGVRSPAVPCCSYHPQRCRLNDAFFSLRVQRYNFRSMFCISKFNVLEECNAVGHCSSCLIVQLLIDAGTTITLVLPDMGDAHPESKQQGAAITMRSLGSAGMQT